MQFLIRSTNVKMLVSLDLCIDYYIYAIDVLTYLH